MAEKQDMNELFSHTLKDVYFAEHAILKGLPKLSGAAQDKALKEALDRHRGETEEQVKRLDKIFGMIGEKPKAEECPAIEGLTEEAEEIIKSFKNGPTRDAGRALPSAPCPVPHRTASAGL